MRVLVDTNVLVRANNRAAGPARELLGKLCRPPHTLITSPFILTELVRVFHYPRLQAQYGLTLQEIRAFVENLQQLAEVVNDPPTDQETSLGTDPDDNPILRAAALGRAEAICTRDRHFQHPAVKQYCDERGIRVLTDIELLQLLRLAERDH